MTKQEKLADALEKEYKTLPEYNSFGGRNNFDGYRESIQYLRTGKLPSNWRNIDLLESCVEDIETLYMDYDIE